MRKIKRFLSGILVFCMMLGMVPAYAVDINEVSGKSFNDVMPSDWYYDAVQYMTDKGLMNGVSNDSFSPQSNTSRAMIVTILWRMEGSPASKTDNSFSDVVSDAYYEDAVIWASEEGIVNGYGDGIFGPDDLITREQLAAILYRYMGSPAQTDGGLDAYSDVDKISSYAVEAMGWAVSQGVINGVDDNVLDPHGFATRAQVATMMMRMDRSIDADNGDTDDDKNDNQHGSSGGSSSGSSGSGSSSGNTDQDDASNPLEGIEGRNPESYSIISAERNGNTFTITYSNTTACNLVVSLYTDDGRTEYMSMSTQLSGPETDDAGNIKMSTATVNTTENIPDTFLLVAVLEDSDGTALSNSFTTRQFTKAYQDYENQTAESLEAAGKEVIDYGDAGYAVAADDVDVIDENVGENKDGSYTLPAGNNVAIGDKIMIPVDQTPDYSDDEPVSVPVRVQSVTENADGTITIVPDENATIGDFYDVLSVDIVLSGDETEESGDLPVARAARSSDISDEITPLKIEESLNIQDHLKIDLEGSLKLKVKVDYDKKNLGEDYLEAELTQTITTGITGTVTGKVGTSTLTDPLEIVDANIPVGTTPLMADVEVTFPVKADISAEGSFMAKLEVVSGYRYTTVDGAQKIANTDNSGIESKIQGKFEVGAGPELSVGVTLPGDLFSANVSGEAMLSLHGDTDKNASVLPDTKHACDLCVDGAIDLGAKIKGSLDYKLFDWVEGTLIEITLFDTTIDICTFYYSAVNDEDSIFKGEPHFEVNKDCPNKSFPITVLAKRSDGQNVTVQIDITYGNDQKPKATISSGETIWLCNGTNYHFKTEIDGAPVVGSLLVAGKEIVTLYGAGINLSGTVTESDSGSPVANAEVTLTKTDDTKTISGSTGSDGRYLLEGIPVGDYTLTVKKDAYQTYEQTISLIENTTHDVKLDPSGSRVSGTVSDSNGPLSGVLVTITNGETTKQCTTDADGTYESDPLTPGEYTVQFSKSGYFTVEKSITISDSDITCDVEMVGGSATLTVIVKDIDGDPISGVSVLLHDESDNVVATSTTDSSGVATFDDLTAGDFVLKATAEGFAPYSSNIQISADNENHREVTLQAGGTCGPTLYWKLEEGVLTIYGEGEMYDYSFTSNNRSPFYGNYDITRIVIGEDVTSIGAAAFNYIPSAQSVEFLGNKVEEINAYAFGSCENLVSISIPDSVTEIGQSAFAGTGITSIALPDAITVIPESAFESCKNLEQVTLGQYVETIKLSAFGSCESLTTIILPNSVKTLENFVFSQCRRLKSVQLNDGLTAIGAGVFDRCWELTSITIPDSVTTFGSNIFSDCRELQEVNLPSKMSVIPYTMFKGCKALSNIIIPESVTEIQSRAFSGTGLASIIIPANVTHIMDEAFYASKLQNVTFASGSKLTEIGDMAFRGCEQMTSAVTIPAGVKKIGGEAFHNTPVLSVTMEGPVEYFGFDAFSNDATSIIRYAGTSEQFDEAVKAGQPDDDYPYWDFIGNVEKTLYCEDGIFTITGHGLVLAQA